MPSTTGRTGGLTRAAPWEAPPVPTAITSSFPRNFSLAAPSQAKGCHYGGTVNSVGIKPAPHPLCGALATGPILYRPNPVTVLGATPSPRAFPLRGSNTHVACNSNLVMVPFSPATPALTSREARGFGARWDIGGTRNGHSLFPFYDSSPLQPASH